MASEVTAPASRRPQRTRRKKSSSRKVRPLEAWKSFGKFVGSHLAFIAPVCVAIGVLFPDQLDPLKPWVTALFAFMTFQGALGNNFRNVVDVFRHPSSMLVTLGISTVAMPVVAYLSYVHKVV